MQSDHKFDDKDDNDDHCRQVNEQVLLNKPLTPKDKIEVLDFISAKIFNELTNEMKSETSMLRFKTFC